VSSLLCKKLDLNPLIDILYYSFHGVLYLTRKITVSSAAQLLSTLTSFVSALQTDYGMRLAAI
jgi:hypothetical protein